MPQALVFAFWLTGYILGIVLFLTPLAPVMGWVLFACLTPVTAGVTYWWFSRRGLPLSYFLQIAVAWTAIAIVAGLSLHRPALPSRGILPARRVRLLCGDVPPPARRGLVPPGAQAGLNPGACPSRCLRKKGI